MTSTFSWGPGKKLKGSSYKELEEEEGKREITKNDEEVEMASVDGEKGIKLEDFLKMWSEDGTKLVEQDRRSINGSIWLLYSVYFSESTYDYGRHMAMLLKVDAHSQVILLHDLENLSGTVMGGGYRSIGDWFERHAGKY